MAPTWAVPGLFIFAPSTTPSCSARRQLTVTIGSVEYGRHLSIFNVDIIL